MEAVNSTWFELEQAVKSNGLVLKHIKDPNKDLCELAVSQNGLALQYVPEKLRSMYICLRACKENQDALEFVPDSVLQSVEFIKNVPNWAQGIENHPLFPKRNLKQDMVEATCKLLREGKLRLWNIDTPTKEECEAAVESNATSLRYVPKEWRSKELCETALKQTLEVMDAVPYPFQTLEKVQEAVEKFPYLWKKVSEDFLDMDLACKVIKHDDFSNIAYHILFEQKYRGYFLDMVVEEYPGIIEKWSGKIDFNEEHHIRRIRQFPECIRNYPCPTPRMWLAYVVGTGDFSAFPKNVTVTEKFIRHVALNGKRSVNLNTIPETYWKDDIVEASMTNFYQYQDTPEKLLKNWDLVCKAIWKRPEIVKVLPEGHKFDDGHDLDDAYIHMMLNTDSGEYNALYPGKKYLEWGINNEKLFIAKGQFRKMVGLC